MNKPFNILSKVFLVIAVLSLPKLGWCQNFVGYSKEYIQKAVDDKFRKLVRTADVKNEKDNYLIYVAEDHKRVIVYSFEAMMVTLTSGKQVQEEICVKYYSRNKCTSYQDCPEMAKVIKSLDSHYERGAEMQWIDRSKKNPQEWVIVRDDDYFEVHVMELQEK